MSGSCPGVMTVRPSGFWNSEAILATSLLGPMPTEATRPTSRRISLFRSFPTSSAASQRASPGGYGCRAWARSTKTSSMEKTSTRGEYLSHMRRMRRALCRYLGISAWTKKARGQRDRASHTDMPAFMPHLRAS